MDRIQAETTVRRMAFNFFRETGLTWNQEGFLAFLGNVREKVPSHILSETDVGRLLEDERRQICPECNTPLYSFGISFDLGIGYYALFSCGRCGDLQKLQTALISKEKGVDVLCRCGAVTHVPPTVWCRTCGKGFPEDWKSKLSLKQ